MLKKKEGTKKSKTRKVKSSPRVKDAKLKKDPKVSDIKQREIELGYKYNRLTTQEKEYVDGIYEYEAFKMGTSVLLWLFLGIVGGHRYYFKDTSGGLLMSLTLGGALMLWLADGVTIVTDVKRMNLYIKNDIISRLERGRMKEKNIESFQKGN